MGISSHALSHEPHKRWPLKLSLLCILGFAKLQPNLSVLVSRADLFSETTRRYFTIKTTNANSRGQNKWQASWGLSNVQTSPHYTIFILVQCFSGVYLFIQIMHQSTTFWSDEWMFRLSLLHVWAFLSHEWDVCGVTMIMLTIPHPRAGICCLANEPFREEMLCNFYYCKLFYKKILKVLNARRVRKNSAMAVTRKWFCVSVNQLAEKESCLEGNSNKPWLLSALLACFQFMNDPYSHFYEFVQAQEVGRKTWSDDFKFEKLATARS